MWTLDAAITMLRADAAELTRRAETGDVPTMGERGTYRWHVNRSCEQVGVMVSDLMRAASGRSLFVDHPLQRRYQDIQAGLGHTFLGPDPVAKAVGGALLGTTTPEIVLWKIANHDGHAVIVVSDELADDDGQYVIDIAELSGGTSAPTCVPSTTTGPTSKRWRPA